MQIDEEPPKKEQPKKSDPDRPVDADEAKRARNPLSRAMAGVIGLGIAARRLLRKR